MAPRASYFKGVMTVDDPDAGYKVTLTERQRYSLEADILQQLEIERRAGRHMGGATIDTRPLAEYPPDHNPQAHNQPKAV